ncbi:anti-repressor SinI family protein [Virgibacillus halodenitrificans]|nr:anti-repressor SinI family protein [Virgibacillus halodenitrificans]WHX25025.1 anti-repressor SinI family protein [Virgibacillus halodenitrificans]
MKDALSCNKDLDAEWVKLILAAFELGISKDEIRDFFRMSSEYPEK